MNLFNPTKLKKIQVPKEINDDSDCSSDLNILKYEAMQRELIALRSQNKKTKIFMYMVIHDLKHPTESLLSSVTNILNKFDDLESKLKILERDFKKSEGFSNRSLHLMMLDKSNESPLKISKESCNKESLLISN